MKYDPEAWAQLAKDAGMKYIVITSKHHDGFALFPSDVTDWDIADASPYGKDLIGPLAKAAREQGPEVRPVLFAGAGLDASGRREGDARTEQGQPAAGTRRIDGDFDEYLDKIAIPQTKEILDRYNLDVLWWDTPVKMNRERAERFLPLLGTVPESDREQPAGAAGRPRATSTRPSSGFPARASTAIGKRA